MPFSPLDALMQATTPPRCLEPPARTDAPAFAPALEQAYQAESPRSVPPSAQPTPQKPQAPKADAAVASDKRQDSEEPADDAVATAEGAEQVEKSQEQSDPDTEETQEDAVEISAEAAAAAGIVQEAKNVEQQVVVNASEDASKADEVKPIDPQAAADAAQKQSEADAAAKLTQELEAAGEGSDGESSEKESAEPVVSVLNSTRRGQAAGAAKAQADVASDSESADKSKVKHPQETATASQADAKQATFQPVDELSVESSTDAKEGPREQASAEKSTKSEESKQATPKIESPAAGDAAAVATTLSSDKIEFAAADASSAAPVAAATDGAPPAADSSQRASSALDRLMAGHSLKQSKDAGEPNGMPTVDRARFVQRVEGAMKAAQQRDGKIQVRLSPPDLGSVKIELAVQNGVLSAKLEAETPAARNLLLDSLPALRERLAQQEIRIEKFDVDVRDQGGNAGSGQADDRTADQSSERQNGRPRPASTRPVAVSTAPARGLAGASSAAGLDVRV